MLAEAGSLMLQHYHTETESDATVQEGAMRAHPNNLKNDGEKFIPCCACNGLVYPCLSNVGANTKIKDAKNFFLM